MKILLAFFTIIFFFASCSQFKTREFEFDMNRVKPGMTQVEATAVLDQEPERCWQWGPEETGCNWKHHKGWSGIDSYTVKFVGGKVSTWWLVIPQPAIDVYVH